MLPTKIAVAATATEMIPLLVGTEIVDVFACSEVPGAIVYVNADDSIQVELDGVPAKGYELSAYIDPGGETAVVNDIRVNQRLSPAVIGRQLMLSISEACQARGIRSLDLLCRSSAALALRRELFSENTMRFYDPAHPGGNHELPIDFSQARAWLADDSSRSLYARIIFGAQAEQHRSYLFAPSTPEQIADYDNLFAEESRNVRHYLRKRCTSWSEAEELAQDTFAKAYQGWNQFQPGTNRTAWLYGIAHKTAINAFKARQSRPKAAEISFDDAEVMMLDANEHSTEEAVLLADHGMLIAALKKIAPEFRNAVIDICIFGEDHEAHAAAEGIKEGTSRSRLHRGIRGILAAAEVTEAQLRTRAGRRKLAVYLGARLVEE